MVEIGSNKTIFGMDNATITGYGFSINSGDGTIPPETNPSEKTNVVIRNIHFTNPATYSVLVVGGSHHIWIDHCTFSNPTSGNSMVEIKKTSDNVTVSWCIFTNTNSSISNTYMVSIGDKPASSSSSSASSSSSSSQFMEEGYLKVTLHHNFFKDDTTISGNHPRVRYGKVHVLNNYYLGINASNGTDGIGSFYIAQVYAEGNYMNYIDWPSRLVSSTELVPGYLYEINNILLNEGDPFVTGGTVFTPSSFYSYTADTAGNIPTIILNFAGAGKL